MMRRLSPRDRRAISVGAAVAIPLCLVIFVIRPLGHVRDGLPDEVAREKELLARELAMLAAYDELRRALDERLGHLSVARSVTLDAAAPIAGSSLTERVVACAEDRGLEVRSAESRGVADPHASPRLVEMDLTAVGNWASLTGFLGDLARESTHLRVVSFSISRNGLLRDGRTSLVLEVRVAGLSAPDVDGVPGAIHGAPRSVSRAPPADGGATP